MQNFPISGRAMPRVFISALAAIKHAAAQTNGELGLLDGQRVAWIVQAAEEVMDGKWDDLDKALRHGIEKIGTKRALRLSF
jgi:fumarate hydratase class II